MADRFLYRDLFLEGTSGVSSASGGIIMVPDRDTFTGTIRIAPKSGVTYAGKSTANLLVKTDAVGDLDTDLAIPCVATQPKPTPGNLGNGTIKLHPYFECDEPFDLNITSRLASHTYGKGTSPYLLLQATDTSDALVYHNVLYYGTDYKLFLKTAVTHDTASQIDEIFFISTNLVTDRETVYWTITDNLDGTGLLEIFSDAAHTAKIAEAAAAPDDGTLTAIVEANASGLYGFVALNSSLADDTDAANVITSTRAVFARADQGSVTWRSSDTWTQQYRQAQLKVSTDSGSTYGAAINVGDVVAGAYQDYTIDGNLGNGVQVTFQTTKANNPFVLNDTFWVMARHAFGNSELQIQNRSEKWVAGQNRVAIRWVDMGSGITGTADFLAIMDHNLDAGSDLRLFMVDGDTKANRIFGTIHSFAVGEPEKVNVTNANLANDCHNGDKFVLLSGAGKGETAVIVDSTAGATGQYELNQAIGSTHGAVVGDEYMILPWTSHDEMLEIDDELDDLDTGNVNYGSPFTSHTARLWILYTEDAAAEFEATCIRLYEAMIPTSDTGRLECHDLGRTRAISVPQRTGTMADNTPYVGASGKRGESYNIVYSRISEAGADDLMDMDEYVRNENQAQAVLWWPDHSQYHDFHMLKIDGISIQKVNDIWRTVTIAATEYKPE